jgi:hypothetical protein
MAAMPPTLPAHICAICRDDMLAEDPILDPIATRQFLYVLLVFDLAALRPLHPGIDQAVVVPLRYLYHQSSTERYNSAALDNEVESTERYNSAALYNESLMYDSYSFDSLRSGSNRVPDLRAHVPQRVHE